jgi:hypothetical protein
MLLLVTQGMPQMRQHAHPSLGRLLTPRHYPNLGEMHALRWAADNDCFQGLHERRWRTMLDSIEHASGRCLFVVVPDRVADAEATAAMFERYHDEVRRHGLPVALVAQDGLEDMSAWLARTWPRIDALFIGGGDDFKLGPAAAAIVAEAKRRRKWVHMGRVNSERRIRYAASIGCDSIDGTKWVRWRDTYLNAGLAAAAAAPQLRLETIEPKAA